MWYREVQDFIAVFIYCNIYTVRQIHLQSGKRAKLEAADGNEIDTMFMDKRSSGEHGVHGDTLV